VLIVYVIDDLVFVDEHNDPNKVNSIVDLEGEGEGGGKLNMVALPYPHNQC
jgi:hypothetical protein